MADMPDDAKPAEVEGGEAPVSPATDPLDTISPVATLAAHEQTERRPSEWTASDARGPLETAGDGEVHSATEQPSYAKAASPGGDAPARSAAETAKPTATPKSRSLWPVAASIVLGALVGAGSAAVMYGPYGQSVLGRPTSADPRVESLTSRVDALEKRPDTAAAVDQLKSTVADLTSKLAAQKTAAAPSAAGPSQTADLAPIEQKVATLQSSVEALKSQSGDAKGVKDGLEGRIAGLETELANAKKETATTQSGLAGIEGQQKALADKIMAPALAVVADSLLRQIDQGQPYTAQVDALTALGADPVKISVLRQNADKGVPSAKALAAKFEPLAEPIRTSARKIPPNAGFVDRLKSGMFSMVSIRGVDDTSGSDLPSRVARIEADLAHDDVADALATWDALPPDAKAKGEAWSALAKTSADAMTAARALQHDAIVALGSKKSWRSP